MLPTHALNATTSPRARTLARHTGPAHTPCVPSELQSGARGARGSGALSEVPVAPSVVVRGVGAPEAPCLGSKLVRPKLSPGPFTASTITGTLALPTDGCTDSPAVVRLLLCASRSLLPGPFRAAFRALSFLSSCCDPGPPLDPNAMPSREVLWALPSRNSSSSSSSSSLDPPRAENSMWSASRPPMMGCDSAAADRSDVWRGGSARGDTAIAPPLANSTPSMADAAPLGAAAPVTGTTGGRLGMGSGPEPASTSMGAPPQLVWSPELCRRYTGCQPDRLGMLANPRRGDELRGEAGAPDGDGMGPPAAVPPAAPAGPCITSSAPDEGIDSCGCELGPPSDMPEFGPPYEPGPMPCIASPAVPSPELEIRCVPLKCVGLASTEPVMVAMMRELRLEVPSMAAASATSSGGSSW
mmetsp:Transcript_329/g.846  ORF Transcript_329/g.846 Transcript_329/m.846 type:complete len:413 (-) Transcript_329:898-2136(-)